MVAIAITATSLMIATAVALAGAYGPVAAGLFGACILAGALLWDSFTP